MIIIYIVNFFSFIIKHYYIRDAFDKFRINNILVFENAL